MKWATQNPTNLSKPSQRCRKSARKAVNTLKAAARPMKRQSTEGDEAGGIARGS